MGSGCIPGSGVSAALLKPTPDTNVIYTGPALPDLGICTGDTLSEVEAVILQRIIDFSEGRGISIPDIDLTQCACFKDKVGCCGKESCQTLICILQAYLDCLCELYADVALLKTEVSAMYDGPYNVKCLNTNSGGAVTNSSKLPAIMQELITEFCALYTQVQTLASQLATLTSSIDTKVGNFLNTALKSCQTDGLVKSGTGASFTATFSGFAPKGSILMYAGPLSVFDSTGKGYNPGPACGWQLCNGLGGSVDMRGYVPVGVNDGTMGAGAQDPRVNNALNPGQSYAFNAITGSIGTTITSASIPSMSVSGTTSSVTGSLGYYTVSRKHASTGDNTMGYMCDGSGTSTPCPSAPNASINFTVPAATFTATVGGGGSSPRPIDVRQPSRAVYFIQRMS